MCRLQLKAAVVVDVDASRRMVLAYRGQSAESRAAQALMLLALAGSGDPVQCANNALEDGFADEKGVFEEQSLRDGFKGLG